MYDLHGKNYSFTLAPTFRPIAEEGCVAVASKTRKNILITIQARLPTLPAVPACAARESCATGTGPPCPCKQRQPPLSACMPRWSSTCTVWGKKKNCFRHAAW